MEITALNNDLVKFFVKLQKKKYRTETGLFLLEGYKSIYEAVLAGIELKHVFVLKEKSEDYKFVKQDLILTTEAVLKKISTTDTPPEVVGVGVQPKVDISKLKQVKKVILLENISDAGNLGTIIRSASAFNIDAIILFGESVVDIYNPKCVRSTVGNLWKTDIYQIKDVRMLETLFSDYERVATLPKNDCSVMFRDWSPNEKTLVMFGSESNGLSQQLIDFSTLGLTIEMSEKVESLDLSVSASIVMHKMGFC